MNVKQRDLVLLPVPFSNQTVHKVRPAIVVSNDKINLTSDNILLVPLTSVIKDDTPYSVLVTPQDVSKGRLITISRARADKIFTAEKSLIHLRIGVVRHALFESIKKEILKTL